ncbi:hypothetical protein VPH35_105830 [Triticum aestivum]
MEAYKFGFGLGMPPAFKFDPTDGDIVAYYLLPRALGLPNPHAHAIIEEDPGSAPPWELLRRHGGDGKIEHAFFFAPPPPPPPPPTDGGRRRRTVKGGGVWQGQKLNEGTVTLLGPGGVELDLAYKRYDLTFKLRAGRGSASTGYVMHEYEITSPPLPGKVLARVNISSNTKKEKAAGAATAGADQQVVVQDPELPGTSYYEYDHDAAAMASNGEGLGCTQAGAPYGGNGVDTTDADSCYTPLPDGQYIDYGLSYTNQLAAATTSHSQGFTGAQADAFYGCGMVGTNGAYYDPSQFVPVASQEVAPWPNQLGQIHSHNQYYAGDSSLMCSGGEQQAGGALYGYNNDGGAMNTESAHSPILPCNGGEENRDEIYGYDPSRRQRRRLQ